MVKTDDSISYGRKLKGTPYSELDCINFIKKIIRTAPGGVPGYTTAGTNSLWKSYDSSPKYKDLTWRQVGIHGARAGMLGFKISGSDAHHVGLITQDGTILHSSSVQGKVIESALDSSWDALGIHRYIEVAEEASDMESYKGEVKLNNLDSYLNVRNGPGTNYKEVGRLHDGTPVVVQAQTGDWLYVTYGDNGLGYVHKEYIARVEEKVEEEVKVPAEPIENPEQFTTLVSSDGVSIRLAGAWRVAEDFLD